MRNDTTQITTSEFTTGAPITTRVHVSPGALTGAGIHQQLGALLGLSQGSRHFLITDSTVDELHGQRVLEQLRRFADVAYVVVPDGEATKSLTGYASLARRVLELGPDEKSTILALGGGIVCNLAGMLAATLYRGVPLIHLPSTVMAQCDASIGHKQAINGPGGKNLLGAYYAPKRIVVDPYLLETLPLWRRRDGFAEIIKHALAQDTTLLESVLDPRATLTDLDFLAECVRRNITLKCTLMTQDPAERDAGMVLQYGHTVGHAVEHLTNHILGHGESVAIGMVFAADVADWLGVATPGLREAHEEVLFRYGLPTEVPENLRVQDILATVARGKRYVDGHAYMALLRQPGELHRETGGCAIPVADRVLRGVLEAARPTIAPPHPRRLDTHASAGIAC